MVQFRNRLFRSKLAGQDNDILSYHFKEQCRLQQQINTTVPSAKSLHDQPSVRVKANGVIVLNKHHHTSLPLDWIPIIISETNYDHKDDFIEDDDDIKEKDGTMSSVDSEMTTCRSSLIYNSTPDSPHSCTNTLSPDSFLSAPPRRNKIHLPRKYHSHPILNKSILPRCSSLPFVQTNTAHSTILTKENYDDWKARLLIEDMNHLQQEGCRIKKQYHILKQMYQGYSLSS